MPPSDPTDPAAGLRGKQVSLGEGPDGAPVLIPGDRIADLVRAFHDPVRTFGPAAFDPVRTFGARPALFSRWRHRLTRRVYDVVTRAHFQAAGSPLDGAEVVVYRSVVDGAFWVRPAAEFLERFEEVAGGT